jgi:hypothetical protein
VLVKAVDGEPLYFAAERPEGRVNELSLWAPGGERRPLPSGLTRLTVGPLDRCGVWRVAADGDGPAVAEVACNLASAAESDLRPPESWEDKEDALTAGMARKPLWFYVLVAALGLTALEWFLYQRRWIS